MHGRGCYRLAAVCFVVAIAVLPPAVSPGAQSRDPAIQLQEATRLMESKGDYAGAARILRDLTKAQDRAVAARAWLLLGDAQAKLGQGGAADAYRRVITEYPEQRAPVAAARDRLALLERPESVRRSGAATLRPVGDDDFTPTGAPSLDGRWLPGTSADLGTLMLLDLVSQQRRPLLTASSLRSAAFVFYTALTPVADEVAFTLFSSDAASRQTAELRLASTSSQQTRTLLSDTTLVSIRPVRWTQDARLLLAALSFGNGAHEIALIARDGTKRTLLQPAIAPLGLDLSPDGRFVVMDAPQAIGSAERDLGVLEISTGTLRWLPHPANDTFPTWTADGSAVVFVSNRTGASTAWLMPFNQGKTAGAARRLVPALGRILPLGSTRQGALYYRVMSGLVDIHTSDVSPAFDRLAEPALVRSGEITGSNFFSSWAPDGRRLAFVSRRAEVQYEPRSQSVVIHDFSTGGWREHVLPLSAASYSAWSPDAQTLLLCGTGTTGDALPRQGLWLMQIATGTVTPFLSKPGTILRSPRWSADGSFIFYSQLDGKSWVIVERDRDSGEERQLTTGADEMFELSPDGGEFTYVERAPSGQRLVLAARHGEARRTLAEFAGNPRMIPFAWSPDGDAVFVSTAPDFSDKAVPTEVWSVTVKDGTRRRVAGIPLAAARTLRLRPDGRALSFEAGVPNWDTWVMENILPKSGAR